MDLVRAKRWDAVVVGAGPNGLAAAIMLARAGVETLLVEASTTPGGGMRSAELTLPGFTHDVCSAVHPLGCGSPLFRTLGLDRFGLEWVESPAPLAHVMADGEAVLLERSLEETATGLGPDGDAYVDLMRPFVERFHDLAESALAPLRFPKHPLLLARFGLQALRSMRGLAYSRFRGPKPRALLAGIAAHAMVPLERLATSSFALVLATAGHAVGWPIARGGSQAIANALVACFRSLGGELAVDRPIRSLADLPPARAYLFDVSPAELLRIAGDALSPRYTRRARRFRYGPGTFKVDWALNGPIPWADARCGKATTVHLAGDFDAIAEAVSAPHEGRLGAKPFVLLGQPSLSDSSRSPEGTHTAWGYCHVPAGSTIDALAAIEDQIERVAPGFRDRVVARATRNAAELERYNPNYVGGDINCGLADLAQLFFRPMLRVDPYATSSPEIFLCSAATPPGGGVHGMCGYWAARSVLAKRFGIATSSRTRTGSLLPSSTLRSSETASAALGAARNLRHEDSTASFRRATHR